MSRDTGTEAEAAKRVFASPTSLEKVLALAVRIDCG